MDQDSWDSAVAFPERIDEAFISQHRLIFQIVPSDRRPHADLFTRWIDRSQVTKDEAFYPCLVQIMRDDPACIREFDRLMAQKHGVKRTFRHRILKALNLPKRSLPDSLSAEHFADDPQKLALHALWMWLYGSTNANEAMTMPTSDVEEQSEVAMQEQVPDTEWQELALEIARLCDGLSQPDPEVAGLILGKAESLLESCGRATEALKVAERLGARAQALQTRLVGLGLGPEAGGFSIPLEAHVIEALEMAFDAVEAWQQAVAAASQDIQGWKMKTIAAVEADDDEGVEQARKSLLAARESLQQNEATLQVSQVKCRALLGLAPVATAAEPGKKEAPEEPPADACAPEPDLPEPDVPDPGLPEPAAVTPPGPPFAAAFVEPPASSLPADNEAVPSAAPLAPIPLVAPAALLAADPELESLLARYLDEGETAFAFHLAVQSEARGCPLSIPSPLLEALLRMQACERSEDVAEQKTQTLMADVMAALSVVENEGVADRLTACRTVAAAGLLRPALFDFSQTARAHLGRIPTDGLLQPYAPLLTSLSGLGFDICPMIEEFAILHGREKQRRTPGARADLQQWRDDCRKAHTAHQPTWRILHKLVENGGQIGACVENILQGAAGVEQEARELLDKLADAERFVRDAEEEAGRPRRDRITGTALVWIRGYLEEGRERLETWLDALTTDAALESDRAHDKLRPVVGSLLKACKPEALPIVSADLPLLQAVDKLLQVAVLDLHSVLAGEVRHRSRRSSADPLDLPLTRLPALCQRYWRAGDAYEAERARQRQGLFAALQKPETISRSYEEAFADRCRENAALAARRVLEHLASRDGSTAAQQHKAQELDELIGKARERARTQVLALQQDLATLLYLDRSRHEEEIRGWRERLEQIFGALAVDARGGRLPMEDNNRIADVPPDFPELDVLLCHIAEVRDGWRTRIQAGQIEELEKLRQQPKYADAAAKLISDAPRIDPVTLDDMIATLTDGHDPLPPADSRADGFTAFFPCFVDDMTRERGLDLGTIVALAADRQARGPFDFSGNDDSATERAEALIGAWIRAGQALKSKNHAPLEQRINELLGQIGFTSVRASQDRVLVPQRLHVFGLKCDRLSTQNWFLPPDFGSGAQGNYRVLVASGDVQPSHLATAIGEAPDSPWIILHFTRMASGTRCELARIMRQDKRVALLLDETLLLYLTTTSGDSLEQFFTCAAPFAWLQPYTTNPRNIPPEMFFGRRDEMDLIVSRRAAGNLIYGGRQLGKSALLNYIRHNQHKPEQGRIALYLDIQDIGEAPVAAEEIWTRLLRALPAGRGGPSPAGNGREQIREAILAWLKGGHDRRLLVMFDEADHFLAAEHPAYPNLRVMKDLMEETGWRFKAVFAGLHNVRRLSCAPNSPLVHLGTPVCVGPMNGSPENQRALRRLVEQPMRAAGYMYDPPGLAADIAARVNHYPSLVQVFCKEVLVAAGSHGAESDGPRWMLSRERLFEGGLADRITQEIRQRFQWTLDLDPRYDLVAKCLAMHRLDQEDGHAAVLRNGLDASKIHELAREWWPAGIAPVSGEDFKALLEEMVDLGVLGKREGQCYGLRNAQVAQMLGTREIVESELLALAEKEPKADYDAGTYHRPSDPAQPDSLSPLPDRQLEGMFSAGAGLKILFAPTGLWGDDMPERLRQLALSWSEETKPAPSWSGEVELFKGRAKDLPAQLDRRKTPRLIVMTSPWEAKIVEPLQARIAERRGRLQVVWLLEGDAVRETRQSGLELFFAPMLGDIMLRRWLARHGLAGLDDRVTRRAILRASGGSLQRLRVMRPLLAELRADMPERRALQLSDWAKRTPLKPQQAGLAGAAFDTLTQLAGLLDRPTDRKDVEDMFPVELPTFMAMGLVETLPDNHVQLSPLGALLVN